MADAPPDATPPLPTDLAACHAMIGQLLAVQRELSRTVGQLEHRLGELLRKLYGRSSERLDPNQRQLFAELLGQLQEPPPAPPPPAPPAPPEPARPKPAPHGRRRLPADLPRQRVEHDLSDAEKPCPCCGQARHRIGEEVTERLDFVPAKVFVIQHVQFKYACAHCEQEALPPQIALAPKPPEVIEKGLAAPGLLAQVIVCKYADHLPLHRLERILDRSGIEIARSTMCDWAAGCAQALRPLYDLMVSEVRRSAVVHTDDTPVDVLDKGRAGTTRTGRFWVYVGDRSHPQTVFDYTPDRKGAGPRDFLGDFGRDRRVYVQADAYAGYDRLYAAADDPPGGPPGQPPGAPVAASDGDALAVATTTAAAAAVAPPAVVASDGIAMNDAPAVVASDGNAPPDPVAAAAAAIERSLAALAARATGVVEVACWAHVRRKFYEARHSDVAGSAQALAYIRLLYDVEDAAKEGGLDPAATAALRRERSLPRLAQLKAWLQGRQYPAGPALPKSPMGQAIAYALNQFDALCAYVADGRLNIDNNAAENALRRIAVGRKNWLFCGADAGGHTAAVLFSLIATCDRHRVNAYQYLRDVLTRLPACPISQLHQLLPGQWQPPTSPTP